MRRSLAAAACLTFACLTLACEPDARSASSAEAPIEPRTLSVQTADGRTHDVHLTARADRGARTRFELTIDDEHFTLETEGSRRVLLDARGAFAGSADEVDGAAWLQGIEGEEALLYPARDAHDAPEAAAVLGERAALLLHPAFEARLDDAADGLEDTLEIQRSAARIGGGLGSTSTSCCPTNGGQFCCYGDYVARCYNADNIYICEAKKTSTGGTGVIRL
ncbi:hypothetical protein L6V77_23855 [Myxococcota bacterium]|nr:hypothetical protein [Myxococcota bacterium]